MNALRRPAPLATFEAHAPPSFRERVAALVGGTTWREPGAGARTGPPPLPAAHAVAATLGMARRSPADISPDIAIDIALGTTAHYQRVCEWMGRELSKDRCVAVDRCRAHLGWIAVVAYRAVVLGDMVPPAPEGCPERQYGELVLYSIIVLQNQADDALHLAARRWGRR